VVAAILHGQRRAYFGSVAPWLSATTCLAALGPHLYWLATTGAKPCVYKLGTHADKPFHRWLTEALLFVPGAAMVLALPALAWVPIAGERLKKFLQDFRGLDSGLWLLFLMSVGTIVFPIIAGIMLRSDMESIRALQGLFVFLILTVCGASYPIERICTVNLAVAVIGITVFATLVAAPVHALYRNSHPLHEGRNFYRKAAEELTRQWHAQFDTVLPAVGGDDDLAFAVAFYSPDHPSYERRLVDVPAPQPLASASFGHGWAALCFGEDAGCVATVERIAGRASRVVRFEIVARTMLFEQPGASQRFIALWCLPLQHRELRRLWSRHCPAPRLGSAICGHRPTASPGAFPVNSTDVPRSHCGQQLVSRFQVEKARTKSGHFRSGDRLLIRPPNSAS
jgi:MFS family permease